jgi:TfoX/Sxy family transcriptional regulator of competence genes
MGTTIIGKTVDSNQRRKSCFFRRPHLPPDEALLSRVRAALAQTPHVEEKKMFGGIAFMVGGKMCVTVGRDRIMCRIDPAIHDAALERAGCRTVVMKGREYRGYVHVDAKGVKSRRDLDYWIGLSLDYNGKLQVGSGDKERRPKQSRP